MDFFERSITGLKPLSVNKAWRGGVRYKTKEYVQYIEDLSLLLGKITPVAGFVAITLKFVLPKATFQRSDLDNYTKPVFDILVKNGVIDDDRFVTRVVLEKALGEDYAMHIKIEPMVLGLS